MTRIWGIAFSLLMFGLAAPSSSLADMLNTYSAIKLPVSRQMNRMSAGIAVINQVEARWFVFSGGTAEECREEADRLGWKVVDEFTAVLPSLAGGIRLAGYRRKGDIRMLVMVLPDSGPGSVVMAVLDGPINLSDGRGEAPGREPAGIPRVSSARRLLHLSGSRMEASFYSSPAEPAEVLSSARRILELRGWQVSMGGPGILLASRAGEPDLAYFARSAPGGSRYLVFASRRNK